VRTNLIFFITSRSVLLRMRHVSDKRCTENQNTQIMFNCFFPNIMPFIKQCGKILSSVQWEPSRAIRTETGMTKLCAILRTHLETRSVPAPNHRDSYKLVFKIQRWLNCRTGTKHGSFTGIPTQPISNQQTAALTSYRPGAYSAGGN
jgi:hypothetical protein